MPDSFSVDPEFQESTTAKISKRSSALLEQNKLELCSSTDQIFRFLLFVQWLAAIFVAVTISPRTWIGGEYAIHTHVWGAIIAGVVLTLVPMALIRFQTGVQTTRYVVAIAQMGWSIVLIHLTGGRIETHFHIFGSLAFLAFYRDWKVIAVATLVVAADHFFRGVWWPQSVFGIATESPYRWLEHAAWVIFEDIFLLYSVFRRNKTAQRICTQQAEMESRHEQNLEVHKRAMSATSCGISIADASLPNFELIYVNDAFERITGYSESDAIGTGCRFLEGHEPDQPQVSELQHAMEQHKQCRVLLRSYRKDGSLFWNQLSISPIHDDQGVLTHYLGIQTDVTDREEAYAEMAKQAAELASANENLANEMEVRLAIEKDKEILNKKLVAASRSAGMAEVATGVLHNVGNVMNSINTSVEMLSENLGKSRIDRIQRVVNLMNDPDETLSELLASDTKGKQIPAYLEKLASHLEAENGKAYAEAESLKANISHVAEIVSMQQTYARLGGMTEEFSLEDLCQDAIKINDAGLVRHGVDLTTEFAELPNICTEKHKALQILVNFVSNAKYAVSAKQDPDKQMKIRTYLDDDKYVAEVSDNGIGMSAEVQGQIFRHGFTTKKEGHGFGLHSSILSAREIGGDVEFESEGEGLGATFRLILPATSVDANKLEGDDAASFPVVTIDHIAGSSVAQP